jgi:hypothetical protein
MHRLSDPNSRPADPVGKAAVREVDGEKAERNLSRTKMASETIGNPRTSKKAQISRFLRVDFGQGEPVGIHPNSMPAAQQPAGQPVKAFVSRY